MNVRPLHENDVPEVLAIQSASLQASSWTADDYAHLALRNFHGWVAVSEASAACSASTPTEDPGAAAGGSESRRDSRPAPDRRGGAPGLLGFLIARFVADEMEILNLAVLPSARRARVGTALLREGFLAGERAGCSTAFLEVRASNASAAAFYQSHHFQISGRRPLYYHSPLEDALLLARAIPSP